MLDHSAKLLQQILPSTLASQAAGAAIPFMQRYGLAPLLCVALPSASGSELEAALTASVNPKAGSSSPAMAFQTEVATQGSRELSERALGRATELEKRLKAGRHFILPLIKRNPASMLRGQVSVGRARNTDVVLRDPSVSKFHAWFEVDSENNTIAVADADSKNGTFLRGKRIPSKELSAVDYGEVITFGRITTFLCDATSLWDALHGS